MPLNSKMFALLWCELKLNPIGTAMHFVSFQTLPTLHHTIYVNEWTSKLQLKYPTKELNKSSDLRKLNERGLKHLLELRHWLLQLHKFTSSSRLIKDIRQIITYYDICTNEWIKIAFKVVDTACNYVITWCSPKTLK